MPSGRVSLLVLLEDLELGVCLCPGINPDLWALSVSPDSTETVGQFCTRSGSMLWVAVLKSKLSPGPGIGVGRR